VLSKLILFNLFVYFEEFYCRCGVCRWREQNGLTALHLASKEGHINVIDELVRRGAAVDASTKVQ